MSAPEQPTHGICAHCEEIAPLRRLWKDNTILLYAHGDGCPGWKQRPVKLLNPVALIAEVERLKAARPDEAKVCELISAYRDSNLTDRGLTDLITSLYDQAAD